MYGYSTRYEDGSAAIPNGGGDGTAIYISIAFGIGLGWFMQEGGMMLVLGMVIGQYLLKAGLALCDTPFFYLLTRKHQEE